MKKLIAILLTFGTFQVQAGEATPLDYCTTISQTAETIAEGRFIGLPMSEALRIAEGSDIITAIVMDAYDLPAYQTPSMQKQEAREFANRVMRTCMKAFNKEN